MSDFRFMGKAAMDHMLVGGRHCGRRGKLVFETCRCTLGVIGLTRTLLVSRQECVTAQEKDLPVQDLLKE